MMHHSYNHSITHIRLKPVLLNATYQRGTKSQLSRISVRYSFCHAHGNHPFANNDSSRKRINTSDFAAQHLNHDVVLDLDPVVDPLLQAAPMRASLRIMPLRSTEAPARRFITSQAQMTIMLASHFIWK